MHPCVQSTRTVPHLCAFLWDECTFLTGFFIIALCRVRQRLVQHLWPAGQLRILRQHLQDLRPISGLHSVRRWLRAGHERQRHVCGCVGLLSPVFLA